MSHPTSDAGWIDIGATDLTEPGRDQRIRLGALDRAIGVAVSPAIHFDGGVDDFVLGLAARFEAYIRDGAA